MVWDVHPGCARQDQRFYPPLRGVFGQPCHSSPPAFGAWGSLAAAHTKQRSRYGLNSKHDALEDTAPLGDLPLSAWCVCWPPMRRNSTVRRQNSTARRQEATSAFGGNALSRAPLALDASLRSGCCWRCLQSALLAQNGKALLIVETASLGTPAGALRKRAGC